MTRKKPAPKRAKKKPQIVEVWAARVGGTGKNNGYWRTEDSREGWHPRHCPRHAYLVFARRGASISVVRTPKGRKP